MAKDRFNIIDILSGLNPNIDADVLKAARYFTRGERDLAKLLRKPSAAEKRTQERLGRVKSEDVLKQEIAGLFGGSRAEAEKAMASGAALGESLAAAIRGAAGGVAGATGADSSVSPLLQSAMQAGEGVAGEVRTGLESLGRAAAGSTGVQEAAAIAAALGRRSDEVGRLEDTLTEQEQARQDARRALVSGGRSNWLQMVTSLLGLKPSGGYGSGSASTTTTPGTAPQIKNLFGQNYMAGDILLDSGYFLFDPATKNPGQNPSIPGLQSNTSGSPVMPNVYRPGYGPSGTQGPRNR
jgi:hypothetical protein